MIRSMDARRPAFEGPCYAKLLASHAAAGSIIGRNGAVITQLEHLTGCSMRLSSNSGMFPGTQDRVLALSGTAQALDKALEVILERVVEEHQTNPSEYRLRIVVPRSTVPALIGRGGEQIRALRAETGAKVQIANGDDRHAERMVSFVGALNEIRPAAARVVALIQKDPYIAELATLGYARPNAMLDAQGEVLGHHCEITVRLDDAHVAFVIGKSGNCLSEMQQLSGARIHIPRAHSADHDSAEGTAEHTDGDEGMDPGEAEKEEEPKPAKEARPSRVCTISGTLYSVHSAHFLLMCRLAQIRQHKSKAGARAPRAMHYPEYDTNYMSGF